MDRAMGRDALDMFASGMAEPLSSVRKLGVRHVGRKASVAGQGGLADLLTIGLLINMHGSAKADAGGGAVPVPAIGDGLASCCQGLMCRDDRGTTNVFHDHQWGGMTERSAFGAECDMAVCLNL